MSKEVTTAEPTLRTRGLSKAYGGTLALDDVSLTIPPAQIVGLIGENGAGKSTLVKIFSGVEHPDDGTIEVFGTRFDHGLTPEVVARCGIHVIHQNLGLIGNMSVADNMAFVTGYSRKGPFIQNRKTIHQAKRTLVHLGMFELDANAMVDRLPAAKQTLVAIARALATDARLLILDEPTAALQSEEAHLLFDNIRRLKESGVTSIWISHRMDEVIDICDSVIVLRNGRLISCENVSDTSERGLIELITGSSKSHDMSDPTPNPSASATGGLAIDELASDAVGPISLNIGAGEIVGVTGLAGSGHLSFADLLLGLDQWRRGTCRLGEDEYRPTSLPDARAQQVAFVPPDRSRYGLVAGLNIRENLFLNVDKAKAMMPGVERERARRLVQEFGIRPPDTERMVSTLSGGNSQKVLLARELQGSGRLLVLCEPTAGVDVGAKLQIHDYVRDWAAWSGAAVVVCSSDFQEVCDLCNRVVVMRRGRVGSVLQRPGLDVRNVTMACYQDEDGEVEG